MTSNLYEYFKNTPKEIDFLNVNNFDVTLPKLN